MRLGRCSAAGTSMNCKDSSKSNPVVQVLNKRLLKFWIGIEATFITIHCKNMRIVSSVTSFVIQLRVTSYACSCRNNKWSAFPC